MTKFTRAALIGASLVLSLHSAQRAHAQETDQSSAGTQAFAPAALRGYGTVTGVSRRTAAGSVLEITCEDADKAKLTHAKYLSDLGSLPRVKPIAGPDFSSFEIQDQGNIAAFCDGDKVVVLAAGNANELAQLVKQVKPSGATTAQAQVPMWLDRWDKYCFRHYYRPWELPKGETEGTYDFVHEFDYAQQQDKAGFVIHTRPLATDSADGMMNTGFDDWSIDEAARRNLPVDIHLSANAASEPTWLLNRFREQTQLKMPGFTGNFHTMMSPYLGGQGVLSWSAATAEDDRLALLQSAVRRFMANPNVTSVLEPHGELRHGTQDIFLEYGPVVDADFRQYLKGRYGAIENVSKRWGRSFKSWDDVRLPEVASFAGWGPSALDVGGSWRIGHEELSEPVPANFDWGSQRAALKSKPAPNDWFKADFDDSDWPEIPGAGHDRQLFIDKRPAVFRRSFEVSADWRASNRRVWLYVWDLNLSANAEVVVALNGKEVGRSKVAFITPHWFAMDVSETLNPGKNTLAIRVPQGYIAYKTYLSPVEPRQYPNLGEHLNAQWVDFIDFNGWSRINAVRRGMAMIRQAAPNQGITLMAPDSYADGIKAAAIEYGGEFRNTGYMGGFYADYLTSLMRGANLPFSIEPGGPATDLADFKNQLGLYQTEGVQAIDYFIHIGNILWKPDIKAEYEAQRKQLSLMGQSHFAKAEIACFYSDRITQLTGYPWGSDYNQNVGSGYWNWNAGSVLRGYFPYDGLSQSSFANGDADAYRVIIDSNTSVMDEALVNEIDKWVRQGGTFITLAQTGRHTPEKPDSWPIARLTGYEVVKIDRLNPNGSPAETGSLRAAPGQQVFDATWNTIRANGLRLKKNAADAKDLLLWDDGTVAVGARALGKGYVVQLGAKFTGPKIFDRVEPGGNSSEAQQLRRLLASLLDWRGVKPEAGKLSPENEWVWLRPAVTNNGLYDTWTVRNWSRDKSQTVSILLGKDYHPSFAIDMRTGREIPVTDSPEGARLDDIVLEPLGTRVYLTPRRKITEAPAAWFDLQRKWWRGGGRPDAKPMPAPIQRFARELTDDWKFKTLDNNADAAPMLAADFNDAGWKSRPLGIWNVKEEGAGRAVFRKTFTVPAEWKNGPVSLWMTSWSGGSFVEKGRVWLDGKEVKPLNKGPYIAEGFSALQPGSRHTLAVEAQSAGVLAGLRGQCWLSFEPAPSRKLDLAGQWSTSGDGLRYDGLVSLPGKFGAQYLKRTIFIDDKNRGRNVVITIDGDPALISVLINGKLVRRHHHMLGERGSLNLTPFVRFGEDNEIELVRWGQSDINSSPSSGGKLRSARELFIGFYDPDVYP